VGRVGWSAGRQQREQYRSFITNRDRQPRSRGSSGSRHVRGSPAMCGLRRSVNRDKVLPGMWQAVPAEDRVLAMRHAIPKWNEVLP